uniref:Ubs_36 putative toxin n=1 Tax=Unedogemmula bisaya TaxID=746885 RepID=A0A098LXY1_UNEBI
MEGRRFGVVLFLAIGIHSVEGGKMRTTIREKTCEQEADPGQCFAHIPMIYYDSDTKTCRWFVYGGCDGNDNRFHNVKACRDYCVRWTGWNTIWHRLGWHRRQLPNH